MSERVRRAQQSDVERIVELCRELAVYERAPDEFTMTVDQLSTALFGADPTVFAHVAENDAGVVVGTAVWFLTFSTWDGVHGIYLEDLYVTPEQRGTGLGFALLVELARECVRNGYTRLQWAVLDWNTPSIEFYDRLGAKPLDEWITYRLSGDALAELGGR
ncbi:MAG TPA: GNAT family N-acetyltransferase [Pseudonocardiaceae bacterium]|jgi:GNAT superfamily N-acetyltransferase